MRLGLGVDGVWSEIEIARPPHGPKLNPYLGEALGLCQVREHPRVRRVDAPAQVHDYRHSIMEPKLQPIIGQGLD